MSIPAMMQAVVLEEEGGPLFLRQRPVPQPGKNEVLIRMAASPINPSDLGFLRGMGETKRTLPAVPGIEGSGTVVASGSSAIARFMMGRHVACVRKLNRDGAWAEYMVTSAVQCVPLRKSLSFELGSMLVVNTMTVVIFLDMVKKGKHAAVVNTAAASQLGQMLVRLSLKHGFGLINIVRREEQAETLRTLGAQYVLISTEADFDEKLKTLARQLKATLVLDAIGGPFTQCLIDASPDGSLLVFYSSLAGEPASIRPNSIYNHGRRVEGFYLAPWAAKNGVFKVLQVVLRAQTLLRTNAKITIHRRIPLSEAQEGLMLYQKNMSAGKVLFVMDAQA
jgi:NADPH:quinone reductase-like Zn-dependent oxidoreductase